MIFPEGYRPALGLFETEKAIHFIKDYFQRALARNLTLTRVSAPLFVLSETGLNDNLSGVERPVEFTVAETGKRAEIVHSLAKWKRFALHLYEVPVHEGIYTDMNAVRREEVTDPLHSVYVDQWDWEKAIEGADRNENYLKGTVEAIYRALRETEQALFERFPTEVPKLPEKIAFVSTQELEDAYPGLSPAERESAHARKVGAMFLSGIGGKLKSGKPHDMRAPDYDDWTLNGDVIVWYPLLGRALELSSMGIRVDAAALARQLRAAGAEDRMRYPFHRAVASGEYPLSMGGGIGQSRLCMFLLNKAHIGEVQSSVWREETLAAARRAGVTLL